MVMGEFDSKERIRQLFLEFEQVDKVHHGFILDFENEVYNLIYANSRNIILTDGFPDALKQFAISIINTAYSVLEKDKYYSDYRMVLELETMQALNKKVDVDNNKLANELNCKVREVVTSYFTAIFELSGDGFRLLALCIEYNVKDFIIYLKRECNF